MDLPDFVRSGNQAVDPELYDIENEAIDRSGHVWDELERLAPWTGRVLLDLGCGSGFWLPRYQDAAKVIGVEPDTSLLHIAQGRTGKAQVLHGSAEHIPLPDDAVDVVHARFAYFFPTVDFDPTPGLLEVGRVLRPGGTLVVIDNDTEEGEFADLLKASSWATSQGQDIYARDWWRSKGARTTTVMSSWEFDSRGDLEAVLRLEFPEGVAGDWLETHPDRNHLSYGYLLHSWYQG
ncbi:class I SAM-dependent methyltransferase [Ornithinimicrobium panacihumi]|uniref:class I SAM-dependent methyltransferase n=1 Tax=Ornithinimicrobium panacihumi TaxID=2008449 RepID=UPI003F8BBAE5